MSKALFVTGTGTDVGKTYVAALMAKALKDAGLNGRRQRQRPPPGREPHPRGRPLCAGVCPPGPGGGDHVSLCV